MESAVVDTTPALEERLLGTFTGTEAPAPKSKFSENAAYVEAVAKARGVHIGPIGRTATGAVSVSVRAPCDVWATVEWVPGPGVEPTTLLRDILKAIGDVGRLRKKLIAES